MPSASRIVHRVVTTAAAVMTPANERGACSELIDREGDAQGHARSRCPSPEPVDRGGGAGLVDEGGGQSDLGEDGRQGQGPHDAARRHAVQEQDGGGGGEWHRDGQRRDGVHRSGRRRRSSGSRLPVLL